MASGSTGVDTLAPLGAATETGQVGFRARVVQKDQLGRVKARPPLSPEATRPSDGWTVLLAGTERLFLYVNPIFPNTTLIACKEHSRAVAARNFFKVRSVFLASNDRIWLRWVATIIACDRQFQIDVRPNEDKLCPPNHSVYV